MERAAAWSGWPKRIASPLPRVGPDILAKRVDVRHHTVMTPPVELLGLYLHLARASRRRMRPHACDRLLVLSAALAAQMGLSRISAACRARVLAHNPKHMLHRWQSLEVALQDEDFQHFLRHLQRRYPLEKAERMLDQLGIIRGNERAAYFSDEEYAAALLDETLESLDRRF